MKTLIFLCCFIFAAACLQAQVIIHVPADYPTIQGAITAAIPGDTVIVSEGTYYEQIDFMGKKPLVVASLFLLDGNAFHILSTRIDGSQIGSGDDGSIVSFISGEDTTSVLCGFTIQNGNKGTAITGPNGEPARVGGAIHLSASGAKIVHNRIINNHLIKGFVPGVPWTLIGAGICCDWVQEDHWIILDHNTFDNNTVESDTWAAGAGAAFISYNAIITDNYFSNNSSIATSTAYSYSGALTCATLPTWNLEVYALIEGNTFKNNEVSSATNFARGGAILADVYECVFSDNTFESNSANGSDGVGGGLYLSNPMGSSLVSNNVFDGNISNIRGGGLSILYEVGSFPNINRMLAENNIFTNNEAPIGGGLSVYDKPVMLQNNVFSGNHASSGGAVFLEKDLIPAEVEHLAVLMNNSFSENKAVTAGGAIHSVQSKPLIINSIFWNDSSNVNGGPEIYLSGSQDTVEMANCDIDLSLVNGNKIDGGGNINADPLFEDPELLTLTEVSPCVNTGIKTYICGCGDANTSPGYDINDTIRPQGAEYDMGAHEFYFAVGLKDPVLYPKPEITCYPNPGGDILNFQFSMTRDQEVLLQIFDMNGREAAVVANRKFTEGEHSIVYDVSALPSGAYFYRLTTGGRSVAGKIAVAR